MSTNHDHTVLVNSWLLHRASYPNELSWQPIIADGISSLILFRTLYKKLGRRSDSMDTASTNLQPHKNAFEYIAKCSKTPIWRHHWLCASLRYFVHRSVCWWTVTTIRWRHQMETFPRYWPFVWGIHRSPVNSPHKGQWRGAFMFSLNCVWINGWVNNRDAGDLRRYRAHNDVIVMICLSIGCYRDKPILKEVSNIMLFCNTYMHNKYVRFTAYNPICIEARISIVWPYTLSGIVALPTGHDAW